MYQACSLDQPTHPEIRPAICGGYDEALLHARYPLAASLTPMLILSRSEFRSAIRALCSPLDRIRPDIWPPPISPSWSRANADVTTVFRIVLNYAISRL